VALFSATVHPSGRLIVGVDEVAQDELHLTDRLTSRANAGCREVVYPEANTWSSVGLLLNIEERGVLKHENHVAGRAEDLVDGTKVAVREHWREIENATP